MDNKEFYDMRIQKKNGQLNGKEIFNKIFNTVYIDDINNPYDKARIKNGENIFLKINKKDIDDLIKVLLLNEDSDENEKFYYLSRIIGDLSFVYDFENIEDKYFFDYLIVTVLNYFEKNIISEYLKNAEYTNDNMISMISQIAEKNPKKYGNVLEGLNDYRESLDAPNLNEFEMYFNEKNMNNDMFEFFSIDVVDISKKYGRIPEDICDYYIKQALSRCIEDENMDYDIIQAIQFVLVDKTRHVLENAGIYNCNVGYNQDFRMVGGYNGDIISFYRGGLDGIEPEEIGKQVGIKSLLKGSSKMINTMFHEIEHAIQFNNIKNENIGSIEYKWIKEQIIRKLSDSDFYKNNYKVMAEEIGARIAGKQKQYEYLEKLGFTNEEILKLDYELDKELYSDYKSYINEEKKLLSSKIKMKKKGSQEEKTLNQIFSELVKDHPEIIEENPCLAIEYDPDGYRFCNIDILRNLEECKEMKEAGKEDKLLDSYINLGKEILQEPLDMDESLIGMNVIEDAEGILEYEPSSEEYRKIRNNIIENELLVILNENKSSKMLIDDPNESLQQSEENFNLLVKKLQEFALKNPEEDISKKITENVQDIISDKNTENFISLEKIGELVSNRNRENIDECEEELDLMKYN